ncbi:MAG TPA: cyclase family protein [Thermoanaerobaculia bacterium]
MAFIDISPVIDPTINVWPGDTPYARTVNVDMATGGNMTLSDIRTTLHVGAHADAPSHYTAGGEDIASRSLHYYIGPCVVLPIEGVQGRRITPDDLAGKRILASRVLLRTGTFPDHRRWNNDFASLSPELVDWLHSLGVITIGIDTPSVDPFESKQLEAHQAFARNNMANLEGLVLDNVAEGRYELVALPLRIAGGDGSPVRAILRGI